MRKFISLRKEIFRCAEEEKIFVPTQGNFHAHKNKFSCARKYFFMRIEILRLAYGRETKKRCLPPPMPSQSILGM